MQQCTTAKVEAEVPDEEGLTPSQRQALAADNMGLAGVAARRFRPGLMDYDEMFSAGLLGVVLAAREFRPSLGWRFSTFAVACARGEIRREFGRLAQKRAVIFRDAIRDPQVLGEFLADAGDGDGVIDGIDRREQLDAALGMLPPREREIVRRRIGCETLERIAADMGITKERVRQLEKRAIVQLRALVRGGAA